jgi:dienelactone hydrolase
MTVSWARADGAPRTARRAAFYRTEPVAFASADGTTLSGTLLVPNGPGPHPAAVLIQGSGRVPRTALLPLADPLARGGIAVLLHDRRGVGESAGSFARATFDQLADDALAGVRYLAGRPDIAPSQIGLVGSSLGGWVAPLAASRSPAVRFVILEAAPAVTPAEHERMRVESQMRADGRPAADIERALAFMDRKFEVARTGDGWPDIEHLMAEGAREGWLSYTNPPTSLDNLRWNGTHVFPYDPGPALAALRIPVLLLYGALDRIVPPGASRERIEAALRAAGNRDVTAHVLDGANHNFYRAVSGAPGEAPGVTGFVPEYFEIRTTWLRERLDERRPVAGVAPEDAGAAETARGAAGTDPTRSGADSLSRSGGDAPGSQSGSAVPGADPWERGRALAGPGSDQGRTAPRPMLAPRSATRQGARSPGAAPGAHTVRRDPRDVLVPAARRR